MPNEPIFSSPPAAEEGCEPIAFYSAANFPYPPKSTIGYRIRRIAVGLQSDVDRAMTPHNLTNAQWMPLFVLSLGQIDTAAELARACCLDTSCMTRLIDRLEEKGLCQRIRSQDDRRVVHLKATKEGLEAAKAIPHALCAVQNRLLRGFTQEEWQLLEGLLERLLANVDT